MAAVCWPSWLGSGGRHDNSSAMRQHVTLPPPVCVAVQRTHGGLAVRRAHCGGLLTGACGGGSYQNNAARGQGIPPLPPLPAPDSPLG